MDAAALSELRDACAGAMRYAQEFNAYADESEGQAALIIAWQCVVEVTFTRRCVFGHPSHHDAISDCVWCACLPTLRIEHTP